MIDTTVPAVTGAVADEAAAARTEAIRDSAIVLGAIVLALLLVTLVARSLVRPLRTLRDSALRVAHDDLAHEIERVRAGKEPGPVVPIPVHTTEEVGQVAHAVDELHEQAVFLAGEQSRLQLQVGDMFETLSRRSRSLVDQQLTLIDRLERNEEDPERLESLFKLDHLAARMRRNGANLLVLSGAKVPREQADAVPVAAIVNAAASEVEDYTRVVTATVPDSEIVGSVAGDLVHLLAELLDNALSYSPPISQVRVSAVHTGNGGLVIEVSDIGLGMTESDLRVANTRLQSGGEVTPYTARHMGLFVVGRLAQQHGLVVRLRSTIAGEPNSGTTAGVYVPSELLSRAGMREQLDTGAAGHARRRAIRHRDRTGSRRGHRIRRVRRRGRRRPAQRALRGSGHVVASTQSRRQRHLRRPGHGRGGPAPNPSSSLRSLGRAGRAEQQRQAPVDTSAFFASRAQASATVHMPAARRPSPSRGVAGHRGGGVSTTAGSDDAIYQKMLSEWLVDPTDLAKSSDLNWESVWDHGWSAAEAAEDAPVRRTPTRGCRCATPAPGWYPVRRIPAGRHGANGGHSNGGAHRGHEDDDEVESAAEFDTGAHAIPVRDPDAVRASISSHFGGVHAARSHAQETRGTDNE